MALKSVLGDLKKQKTPSNKPAPERPEIDEASRKVLGDQARKVKEMILSDIRSGNRGRLDSNFSYMAAAAGAPQQMRFTSPTEDNAKEWWAEAKKYGGSAKKNATTAENGYEPLDSGKKEKETTIGSLEAKKINAENALNSFDQNADYDWTDAGSRKSHEEKRKQLEKAVEMAGAELAKKEAENTQRKDMEEIGSMSEEAKRHLKALTNQDSFTMNNTLGMTGNQVAERLRGQEQAKEYLRSMGYSDLRIKELSSTYSRVINAEEAQKRESEALEIANNPFQNVVANVASPVMNAAGGVIGTLDTLTAGASRMLGNGDDRYENLDPNLPGYAVSNVSQTIRGETARQISGDEYGENGVKVKDGGALRQLASYGYQGGMSLADSLFQAAAGGGPAGGAALAAANSYSQTVQQASQQGATPEEANALGVTIAGIEFLSEKIPMERMFKTAKSGNTNIFAEALRQASIEASTEEISMISSKVAEAAILRDKSSYKQQIGDLVASGMSYEEAKKQADKAFWKEFGETMIISGISGGISGGGSAYVGNQQNAVADVSEDTGPELLDGPEMAETEQEALTPTPDFISDTAAQLVQEAPVQQTPQLTPEQEQFDRAAAEMFDVQPEVQQPADALHEVEESTAINTNPAVEAQKKTEVAKKTIHQALVGRMTPDVISEITHNNEILQFLHEYADLELYNGRKISDIKSDVRSIFDYAKQNGVRKQMEQSLSRFLDDKFGSEYYSAEYQNAQQTAGTATADDSGTPKEYINLEDYANKESPVWRNVAYEDDSTKSAIMQETHKQMVDSGAIVKVDDGVMEDVAKSYPDLRGVKKKERTPILKQTITTLKNNLRQYLGGISNQSFEFEVNGKILEAKLYSTGINEVLEKVTKEKAGMLYSSEKVFRNARYLYSTPDYDGNPKIYRWNYFYTPVQIGNDTVGVRIAVRDMVKNQESQIYNWGIKKDTPLDGVGGGTNARRPHGVSSDVSNDMVAQPEEVVNQNQPDPMSMSEDDFLDSMGSDRGGAEADPFADRNWHEVGKRSEKAFMHQNPEVKPLFQQEAAMLYSELGDTIKGERTFNGDAYYQSGGESGWSGTKRHTSESIADLLDNGFTYDQIEKGLMSIMEDHGAENNAAAKRIEFIINDRLLNGYTNFYDGSRVPPNADYVEFANGQSAPDTDTKNPSAEGGHRFEAMGAADAGFSGKPAYNATLSETNRQADRRDDVRPMELPKTDVNGNPVSATTGNVYASKLIPDDFASLMEESVARGDFSYMKLTNDRATKMAAENIGKCGSWEDAYRQFTSDVDSGKAGAELAARGAILLNQAAQMGDDNRRLSILADLQQLGTNTAQGLQAMRLIRSLNPPDKIKFIEMMVRRMDHDMKLGGELKVDKALMQEYYSAKTDKARDAVVEKIQQNVASQIPSTFMDKFTALRYVNMLGNLKTNVRNVAGNVGSNLMYKVKDGVATGIEAVTHKLTGAERTKSLFVGDKDLMKACKEDFAQVSDLVGGGGKYGDKMSAYGQFQQGVMDKRQIFKSKAMEGYRKATNWAMNNDKFGDEAFGRAAYSRALAGYLKANGMSGAEFRQVVETGKGNTALVDRARAYAVQQAQEMTFHDNTAMARIMSKLQKAGGPLGQGIMPFTKTPANVLTRAEEFSPLGFINSTVKSIQKARGNVDITGADLIDSWSKTITGSSIFALGAWMMSQGLLTGAPDDDEEKAAFDKLNGVQSYALNFPDWMCEALGLPEGSNYTIDWMTPAAMPLFMGGELMKALEDKELNFSDWEKVFTSIADPMIQMSMMQGINDSLDSIKYADNNLGQFCLNAGLNYLLQGVSNTMLGQLEKSTEENRTTTYVDKDSSTPQWMQRQLGKLSQKIPGWDYQQTDYLDAWGEEQKNVGGTGAGGMAYNLLSPGYLSKEKTSELNDELYRLHESTGENVFPQPAEKTVTYTDTSGADHKDYNLSAEEFATMQKEEGQTAQRLLSQIVGNKDYKALTDAQRAAVVADVYKYAREQGRKAALPGYYSEAAGWIKSMGKDPANAIIQRAALGEVNNAVSSAVDSIENGWNVTDANRQELDSFYDSFKGMSKEARSKILDDAISDTAKYLEMRSKGISTDKYLGAVREIKSLKPEPTYSGIRDIQVREAISGSRKLSEKEKDIVMKAYMPDYNPDAKSPQTTELKYDAIRGLGVSPSGYTDAYRAYLDASGTGKRRRTIAQYQKDYGWDRATAQKVYDIYAGYYKPWNDAQSADPQNASGSGGVSVEDLKRLIR